MDESGLTTVSESSLAVVRAALAEAGYPRATVVNGGDRGALIDGVPLSVAWMALVVAAPEEPSGCWPCFRRNRSTVGCTHDYRTKEWPDR